MRITTLGLSLVLGAGLSACGGDDPVVPGGNSGGSYRGTFGSANVSGILTVTVPATSPRLQTPIAGPAMSFSVAGLINVTATLQLTGGGSVTLTGTLNGVALLLSGSGYSFTGTLSGSGMDGTFTDALGASGTFSVSLSPSGSPVIVYCGTYNGTEPGGTESGTFNLMLASDGTGGAVVVDDGDGDAAVFDVRTNSQGQLEVYPAGSPTLVIARTTSKSSAAVNGTYNDGAGSSGTFSGSVAQCS